MEERLFFAIETICPWPEVFPEGRVLAESDRHITLAFLGQTDPASLLPLLSDFPDPGFPIGLAGCFDAPLFLPKESPRTAGWHVRLFEMQERFKLFQKTLLSWLVEKKFLSRPERDFLPHATIARRPKHVSEWKEAFSILPLYLGNIHLYKSLGSSKYESLWRREIIAPFEEKEHAADIAFIVRGVDWKSLQLHAGLALAFQFPPLLTFFDIKREPKGFDELVLSLNELVARADAECGAPFKAVSYHGDVQVSRMGIWEWEMIVDV